MLVRIGGGTTIGKMLSINFEVLVDIHVLIVRTTASNPILTRQAIMLYLAKPMTSWIQTQLLNSWIHLALGDFLKLLIG